MFSGHGGIALTRAGGRLWGIAAYIVAAISIGTMLSHGWVPIDEGAIALSARMARAGYLPHADFAYPYTGALAFWHALAIKVTGDSMLTHRYALFVAFLAWLPAVWSLARRFTVPPLAAVVVVLAAWWSLLIYPAAMPTWYVLFLTTWAIVALARWNDTGARVWLMMAGLAAGLAIVVKQTGILTLVGAGFGVLAIHQDRERARIAETVGGEDGAIASALRRADPLVVALLTIAMLVPLGLTARRGLLAGEVPMIAFPLAAAILSLAARERELHADVRASRRTLLVAWATLSAYALVAPALLVVFYASHAAVGALVEGAIGGALRTAATIDSPMASTFTIVGFAIPLGIVTAIALRAPPSRWTVSAVAAGAIAVAANFAAMKFTGAYLGVWYFATTVLPVAVVVAAWSSRQADARPDSGLVLGIAAATALLAVNQVPYAVPNYFGYAAPLAFLLATVVAARAGLAQRTIIPAAVLLLFGGWFHRIGNVATVGFGPIWWDDAHALPGPHGRLLVSSADSAQQSRIVALIAEHAGSDQFAAGPELPQLFVLAGTRRLVAQPYLLAPDARADAAGIRAAIDTMRIRMVVLNDAPHFLPPLSASARVWISTQYPNSERVGDVDVRWRE